MSKDKTVLITGASSGIGEAVAKQYANANYQVYACGRNKQRLQSLAEYHKNIKPLAFDLSEHEQLPVIASRLPTIDIAIFNAGHCEYIDNVVNFDADLFKRVINVNLINLAYCIKFFLPKLTKQGRLAIVSSSVTLLPFTRAQAYGASKAGVDYLAQSLAVDIAASPALQGISVTLVQPGFVKTPLTDKNTFAMPCLMPVEQAAQRMIKGIAKRQAVVRFPKRFIWLMQCLSWLPSTWWQALASKMAKAHQTQINNNKANKQAAQPALKDDEC
ncbi:short-chain dehydrogenase [Saccharobesus litoralis]|uniref:Short-chain dehydrogenase n=1 Tax=Saccharobesus litoralis TaxID=2172099 RepID=A0A2S0VMG5_9ALTE|nr:SDR family NAD(P)-dependent oxidoreductase [Saccharobesus litoralis]AWB65408.1 short-chain dehydrogenase [Saccharobesus litoralis]